MLIAEADDPSDIRYVDHMRAPIRLGHSVFVTGKLDPAAIDACVDALKRFRDHLEARPVHAYRAVVTASARDAANADELLVRAKEEAGIELEAISGSEEARLINLAVQSKLPLDDKRALLVDLGGGSLELTEVHRGEVRRSTSLEIGTVRLLESFLGAKHQPVSDARERLLREHIERMLDPVRESFTGEAYDVVAGTGGNFDALAQLCPAAGAKLPTIDVKAARELLPELRRMTPEERRERYGMRPDRADVIVPALYVILRVAELAKAERIVTPGVGLKEGVLVELVDKHFRVWDYALDESAMVRAAIQLGRRYHFDEPHARQVDRLASWLFDSLEELHGLGPLDRKLLRAAALLHDVGDFISPAAHHKHSQYIIENTDLIGLSPEHRQLVACVARYHRRAMPSTSHAAFKKLSPSERKRVRALASILRVADALDRGHRSKVSAIDVRITPSRVSLALEGKEDLALEIWCARRKGELFETTFDRELEFESS